jgi:hypothetical protein
VFERLGVKDVDTRRTRVELDNISAIGHGRVAEPIVDGENMRDGFERLFGHFLRNFDHIAVFFDLRPGLSQQLAGFSRLHFDTRIHHQLVGFVEDAAYQFL